MLFDDAKLQNIDSPVKSFGNYFSKILSDLHLHICTADVIRKTDE